MSDIFLNMHYNPETKNRQSKRKSGFKEELQPTCTQRLSTFHSIQIQPDNLLHHYNMQQPNSLSHPRHRAIQAPTCKQDHRTQHTPVKCHLHRATLQPHHQHQPKKPTTLITYILESNQAYRHLIPLHLHFLSSHPCLGVTGTWAKIKVDPELDPFRYGPKRILKPDSKFFTGQNLWVVREWRPNYIPNTNCAFNKIRHLMWRLKIDLVY